jgi:hypothetical protein
MQKLLNTYSSALFWLTQRLPHSLLKSKAGLVTVITLLCLVQSINPAKAASFYGNAVFITGTVGGNAIPNRSYYTDRPSDGATTVFTGAYLGTFNRTSDRGLDQLFVNARANTRSSTDETVSSTQLLYRVYRADNTRQVGNFIPLPLNYVSGLPTGGEAQWQNLDNKQNLIDFAPTPGTYTLQLYFSANNSTPDNPNGVTVDNNNGDYYVATFDVTVDGSIIQKASWDYTKLSTNWFDPKNWSSGNVPNSNTDVTISAPADQDAPAEFPVIPNDGQLAQVRNIILDATAATNRVFLLTLDGSSFYIHGNFQDTKSSFVQTNGLLGLVGRDQTFDASASLTDVLITGGGTKTLTQLMTIKNRLLFQANSDGSAGGSLITRTDSPNLYGVLLDGGRLEGESDNGYVQGVVINNSQVVSNGQPVTFGNIGVTVTANVNAPNSTAPGSTSVIRTSSVYKGRGTSVSIRRSFYFTSTRPTSDFNLTFSYLTPDLNGVAPSNLRLYRSRTGRVPFEPLGKTSNNETDKTLTKEGITGSLNALFTLGNSDNPLPVTITSFTAVAQGADAILDWATASETDNQGFEVQVSADGTTFSKLGFLASNNPNSSTPHSYQYRDVTAGKQGIRYYRLRQLDLDGTESFVGPRAVTFGEVGIVQATSLQGYPSPFSSEINLALQTTAAGLATVTVTDGVGRQVRTWQPTLAAGASSLRLAELQSMPAGLYIVQVRYNDGQTQRLKMVKE